ncbi:MAG: protein-export chaperone SecB [Gammaproteobacteria bacterium]|nr:protein-export chaperone SecB [Gammaproteobacteria bacterium]
MTDTPEKNQTATNIEKKNGQFSLQKIFVKDISFETPHSPEIFTEEWAPAVNMQISNEASSLNEDLHEVVLAVTVTVTLGEKTAYLVEVHMGGIFYIKGFPQNVVERMAATVCPNILFPFAREVVSDLVTRGGFPQLLLAPVNFEALYERQRKQSERKELEGSAESETKH